MDNWHVLEEAFDPAAQHHKETVFTIGNGYLGTRGTFEEGYPDEQAVTLVHGVFDDVSIVYTELVNAPNWLNLTILIDGERFRMDRGTVLSYQRSLDLRTGVLTRNVQWRSPAGHTLTLVFERFASLADEHVMALRCRITSIDFSGVVEIRAGIMGFVGNDGSLHWMWDDQGAIGDQGGYLTLRTRETKLKLCTAMTLTLSGDGSAVNKPVTYALRDCHWMPTVIAQASVQPGQTVVAHKLVTIFSSRDIADPQPAALEKLTAVAMQGYEALRTANDADWADVWQDCNVVIQGDDLADLAVRFSLFQLLIAAPRHEERVSIPAKTLSGFGYRGHAFWDTEIFMLPFFVYTQPAVARNMLMYRYHTLEGARRKAQENGCEGAMYAWESAATGDEVTPRWVPDWSEGKQGRDLIRIWCGDIELHITADVAYAVNHYWRVTGDDAFLRDYGAEIILDTARFWGSRVEYNAELDVYEISDVIGPDENHEHVDNSAFTNGMARWNLKTALEIFAWLQEEYPEKAASLTTQLDLSPKRLGHWWEVIEKLRINIDPATGRIEQFDGFYDLRYVNFEEYEPRATSLQALLGIEETQKYQILKQPDVLMLLYLLGDEYDADTIKANWQYYTSRTDLTYGSSLGPSIQAIMAVRQGDVRAAYEHFILAARTDLENARGNTKEGIHGASSGGLWQAVVFGFAGVHPQDGTLVARPHLPPGWKRLTFRLRYQGQWFTFEL